MHISENLKDIAKNFCSQPMGIPTGFQALNKSLWGFQPNTLVMLGGRPGAGKSALMADLILATSKEVPVGVFSKEMPETQLPPRLICNHSKLNYHKVKSGEINKSQKKEYFEAQKYVEELPIYVDYERYIVGSENYWITARKEQEPNLPKYLMDPQIKYWVQEKGVKIIFVDYLQILDLLNKSIRDERLKVGRIAEILRDYAKQYNITMVLLSQLRRADKREGKIPIPDMQDLRESGALEAHSDVILLLHRPNYYNDAKELTFSDVIEDDAEIILAKNRDGAAGSVNVDFCAYAMSFRDKSSSAADDLPF